METEDTAWHVVRTLSKRESIASKILDQNEDVEVLCPCIRYKKVTKRGAVWWKEAMFPGYFFARFSLIEQGRLVTHSQGVSGLVHFNKNVPSIPDSIIYELRQELESAHSDVNQDEHTLTLQPEVTVGDDVEIAHGPMIGQKGTITKVLDGHERVAVLLEFLGSSQEVELDLFSLFLRRPTAPG